MEPGWIGPRTEAEASGYRRTSTSAQVDAFVAACAGHSPLVAGLTLGTTTEGRSIPLVLAAAPPVASMEAARRDPRLKVVVMANIHAGEVEGKEAVLVLLREIAEGRHQEILRSVVVALVPNYNPDGNERVDRRNRPDQAGPVEGVGVRHNGADLDLNRDFVKVEAPETQALIRAVRDLDAAMVVDLHATNGSFHGFDLTYAGPLHPGTDPEILEFERRVLLPGLRDRMRARGFETFDYGNWVDEARPASGWATFEARPRFGNSYFGLRNRLTVLSEAYSHDPFEKRIRATHALVVETLALTAAHADAIRRLVSGADERATRLGAQGQSLPTGAKLFQTHAAHPIPVGGVVEEEDPVTGLIRQWDNDVATPVAMPVFAWFEGTGDRRVPDGWVLTSPGEGLARALEIHGIEATVLDRPRAALVECFRIGAVRTASRPFQGRRLKAFEGHWERRKLTLAQGSIYVPAAQPLARLAFALFEPETDDGLAAWDLLGVEEEAGAARFSAVRVVGWSER